MPRQKPATRYSAFCDDALGSLDATALTQNIRRGETSLEEALDAAIIRAQKAQEVIHAVVATDFHRVKVRARKNHPPHEAALCAPAFLKDNLNLEGLPTRFGSMALSKSPVKNTDELVNQLHASGLHFIGKSATPAFGFGCTTEFDDGTPPTRNPWNLDLSAGGSSGGSAALVAAGVVPIAHANDGGGSIRIPAGVCGLVGLKPSRGRLVRQKKAKSLPIDIVSDGVLTRSVRDTANFYWAAENFFRPKHLKPIGLVEGASVKRLRIGFIVDSLITKACPETRKAVETTANLLSDLGHHVEETKFPVDEKFAEDFSLYWSFIALSVEWFGGLAFSQDFNAANLDGLTKGLSKACKTNPLATLRAILRLRYRMYTHSLKPPEHDVVISPVLAKTTPELGVLSPAIAFDELFGRLKQYVGYTPFANIMGNPAISLPLAESSQGAPIGIQLSAAIGEERQLLELAFELETARPWPSLNSPKK